MPEPPRPPAEAPDAAARLAAVRARLSPRVRIGRADVLPAHPLVAAVDVQYEGERASAAMVLTRRDEAPRVLVADTPTPAAYQPGAFAVREGPILLALLEAARAAGETWDVLLVDGHGIAHPQRFGVATWLGVELDVPTVGCAKESLLPWTGQVGDARGSTLDVTRDDEVVGRVVRTQDGVRPMFVSPGHRVGLDEAVRLVVGLCSTFRVPDPIRLADQAARAHRRGEVDPAWRVLPALAPVPL